MVKNLSILTTVVLTAAATAGGTYYYTTRDQVNDTSQNMPVTVTPKADDGQQVMRVAAENTDKPITIVVKTDIKEQRPNRDHIGHIRDLKQPTLRVMPDR